MSQMPIAAMLSASLDLIRIHVFTLSTSETGRKHLQSISKSSTCVRSYRSSHADGVAFSLSKTKRCRKDKILSRRRFSTTVLRGVSFAHSLKKG